ncbi:MAG TPA: hemolysin III, partial [Microbacteriaceae bacterium]|nr:hemolysin III [Microbacteriaceae bacterium]
MTQDADDVSVDQEPGSDLPNIPLLDDEIDREPATEAKPTWRGWIHAGTFPLAIVLGVILIVLADGVAAKVSSSVFVLSSLLLFGVSALYHRFAWSDRTRRL